MSRNSYSIAAIFGEFTGTFSQLKIVGVDQSLLKQSEYEIQKMGTPGSMLTC